MIRCIIDPTAFVIDFLAYHLFNFFYSFIFLACKRSYTFALIELNSNAIESGNSIDMQITYMTH